MDESHPEPGPLEENANDSTAVEGEDELSKTARLVLAAIPLGRIFGIKLYLSVYYVLGLAGLRAPLFNNCWTGRMALLVFALCTPFMYLVAGIVESLVGRKFGAEAKAIIVLPFFVTVSYKKLYLSRKGFVATMMAWPLTVFVFFLFWAACALLLLHTHGAPDGDCVSSKHFFTWIALLEAVVAWYTVLVNLLLPIWPGACFMSLCILISKFGVPKRAALLRTGVVSISLCAVCLIASYGCRDSSFWVFLIVGSGHIYTLLLVLNVLGIGRLLISNSDGASWKPFKFLKEESSNEVEMDEQPLISGPFS